MREHLLTIRIKAPPPAWRTNDDQAVLGAFPGASLIRRRRAVHPRGVCAGLLQPRQPGIEAINSCDTLLHLRPASRRMLEVCGWSAATACTAASAPAAQATRGRARTPSVPLGRRKTPWGWTLTSSPVVARLVLPAGHLMLDPIVIRIDRGAVKLNDANPCISR